ncbi:ROK family protein [Latilactobacillus sakei]|uniref:ROK family protein n=1 Tax=Latilactobacillus sakei TaxID=1599 RepID=UPI0038F7D903
MVQSTETILVLDIGGSAVKYGFWTAQKLEDREQFPTPLTRNKFYQTVADICDAHEPIAGIAVSCPGEPDEDTGIVHGMSYVPFLHLGEFQHDFATQLNRPVSLQNDAESAALAEMTLGVGQNHQNALFTIIGSGIGLAIVQDGLILKNLAEKFDNPEKRFADTLKTLNNSKVSPVQIGKTVSLKNFKLPNTIDGKTVFELAKQGDPIASQEVDQMYASLAEILIFLNAAYQPEIIGIGGGISNNPDLLPELKAHIATLLVSPDSKISFYKRFYPNPDQAFTKPNLRTCYFKNDANLIGAALHYEHRFKRPY